jgi:hypothetical protein
MDHMCVVLNLDLEAQPPVVKDVSICLWTDSGPHLRKGQAILAQISGGDREHLGRAICGMLKDPRLKWCLEYPSVQEHLRSWDAHSR